MPSLRTVTATCLAALCCALVPIGTVAGVEQEITGTDSSTKTYLNPGFHIHDYTATATADVTVESVESPVRINGPVSIEQGAIFRLRIVDEVGNFPPTVAVTEPVGGSVFGQGQDITLTAAADDSDGTVTGVSFAYGGGTIGDAGDNGDGTWSLVWVDPPVGTHDVTATATDDAGGQTTSVPVAIEVVAATAQVGFDTTVTSFAEDATQATITLVLDQIALGEVRATVHLSGGTASEGVDFLWPQDVVVAIPAGELQGQTTVDLVHDAQVEIDETIDFVLQDPEWATIDPDADALTLTIQDAGLAPQADIVAMNAGDLVSENAGPVGDNDQLPPDTTYTFELEDGPENGLLDFRADGTFDYAPDVGYSGQDTFRYRVSGDDPDTHTAIATVTMDIAPGGGMAYSGTIGFTTIGQVFDLDTQDVDLAIDLSPAPTTDLPLLLVDSEGDFQLITVPSGTQQYPVVWPAPVPEDPSDRPDLLIEVRAPDPGTVDQTRRYHLVQYAPPEALVAADDVYLLPDRPGEPYTVSSAQGVLANDFYKGPENLSAVLLTGPTNVDSFTLNADGSFTYDPIDGVVGPSVFTYKAVAGALETPAIEVNLLVEATELTTPKSNDGEGIPVSPWSYTVEGNPGDLAGATITINGVAVDASEILEGRFFHRDVTLTKDPTPFLVRVSRDGETLLSEDHFINWSVTDVAEGGAIDLRIGDSLRCRAPAEVEVIDPSLQLSTVPVGADGTAQVSFSQRGVYTLTALESDGSARGTQLTVEAFGALVPATADLNGRTGDTLEETLTEDPPAEVSLAALDANHLDVATADGQMTVGILEVGTHYLITRLAPSGPIIAIDPVGALSDHVVMVSGLPPGYDGQGNVGDYIFAGSLEFPAEFEGYEILVDGNGTEVVPGIFENQFFVAQIGDHLTTNLGVEHQEGIFELHEHQTFTEHELPVGTTLPAPQSGAATIRFPILVSTWNDTQGGPEFVVPYTDGFIIPVQVKDTAGSVVETINFVVDAHGYGMEDLGGDVLYTVEYDEGGELDRYSIDASVDLIGGHGSNLTSLLTDGVTLRKELARISQDDYAYYSMGGFESYEWRGFQHPSGFFSLDYETGFPTDDDAYFDGWSQTWYAEFTSAWIWRRVFFEGSVEVLEETGAVPWGESPFVPGAYADSIELTDNGVWKTELLEGPDVTNDTHSTPPTLEAPDAEWSDYVASFPWSQSYYSLDNDAHDYPDDPQIADPSWDWSVEANRKWLHRQIGGIEREVRAIDSSYHRIHNLDSFAYNNGATYSPAAIPGMIHEDNAAIAGPGATYTVVYDLPGFGPLVVLRDGKMYDGGNEAEVEYSQGLEAPPPEPVTHLRINDPPPTSYVDPGYYELVIRGSEKLSERDSRLSTDSQWTDDLDPVSNMTISRDSTHLEMTGTAFWQAGSTSDTPAMTVYATTDPPLESTSTLKTRHGHVASDDFYLTFDGDDFYQFTRSLSNDAATHNHTIARKLLVLTKCLGPSVEYEPGYLIGSVQGGTIETNLINGNLVVSIPIRTFPTPLPGPDLILTYNSMSVRDIGLGRGWTHTYDARIYPRYLESLVGGEAQPTDFIVVDGTGRVYQYDGNGNPASDNILPNSRLVLGSRTINKGTAEEEVIETVEWRRYNDGVWVFRRDGTSTITDGASQDTAPRSYQLESIADVQGRTITVDLTGAETDLPEGLVPDQVVGSAGRTVDLTPGNGFGQVVHAGSGYDSGEASAYSATDGELTDLNIGQSGSWKFAYNSDATMQSATYAVDADMTNDADEETLSWSFYQGGDVSTGYNAHRQLIAFTRPAVVEVVSDGSVPPALNDTAPLARAVTIDYDFSSVLEEDLPLQPLFAPRVEVTDPENGSVDSATPAVVYEIDTFLKVWTKNTKAGIVVGEREFADPAVLGRRMILEHSGDDPASTSRRLVYRNFPASGSEAEGGTGQRKWAHVAEVHRSPRQDIDEPGMVREFLDFHPIATDGHGNPLEAAFLLKQMRREGIEIGSDDEGEDLKGNRITSFAYYQVPGGNDPDPGELGFNPPVESITGVVDNPDSDGDGSPDPTLPGLLAGVAVLGTTGEPPSDPDAVYMKGFLREVRYDGNGFTKYVIDHALELGENEDAEELIAQHSVSEMRDHTEFGNPERFKGPAFSETANTYTDGKYPHGSGDGVTLTYENGGIFGLVKTESPLWIPKGGTDPKSIEYDLDRYGNRKVTTATKESVVVARVFDFYGLLVREERTAAEEPEPGTPEGEGPKVLMEIERDARGRPGRVLISEGGSTYFPILIDYQLAVENGRQVWRTWRRQGTEEVGRFRWIDREVVDAFGRPVSRGSYVTRRAADTDGPVRNNQVLHRFDVAYEYHPDLHYLRKILEPATYALDVGDQETLVSERVIEFGVDQLLRTVSFIDRRVPGESDADAVTGTRELGNTGLVLSTVGPDGYVASGRFGPLGYRIQSENGAGFKTVWERNLRGWPLAVFQMGGGESRGVGSQAGESQTNILEGLSVLEVGSWGYFRDGLVHLRRDRYGRNFFSRPDLSGKKISRGYLTSGDPVATEIVLDGDGFPDTITGPDGLTTSVVPNRNLTGIKKLSSDRFADMTVTYRGDSRVGVAWGERFEQILGISETGIPLQVLDKKGSNRKSILADRSFQVLARTDNHDVADKTETQISWEAHYIDEAGRTLREETIGRPVESRILDRFGRPVKMWNVVTDTKDDGEGGEIPEKQRKIVEMAYTDGGLRKERWEHDRDDTQGVRLVWKYHKDLPVPVEMHKAEYPQDEPEAPKTKEDLVHIWTQVYNAAGDMVKRVEHTKGDRITVRLFDDFRQLTHVLRNDGTGFSIQRYESGDQVGQVKARYVYEAKLKANGDPDSTGDEPKVDGDRKRSQFKGEYDELNRIKEADLGDGRTVVWNYHDDDTQQKRVTQEFFGSEGTVLLRKVETFFGQEGEVVQVVVTDPGTPAEGDKTAVPSDIRTIDFNRTLGEQQVQIPLEHGGQADVALGETETTASDGEESSKTTDNAGRLAVRSMPGQDPIAIQYDSEGKMIAEGERQFTYEAVSKRLKSVVDTITGSEVRVARNSLGRVTHREFLVGGTRYRTTDLQLDPSGRVLDLVQRLNPGDQDTILDEEVDRDYQGRVVTIAGGDLQRRFVYDRRERMVEERHFPTGARAVVRQYVFDWVGNRTFRESLTGELEDLVRDWQAQDGPSLFGGAFPTGWTQDATTGVLQSSGAVETPIDWEPATHALGFDFRLTPASGEAVGIAFGDQAQYRVLLRQEGTVLSFEADGEVVLQRPVVWASTETVAYPQITLRVLRQPAGKIVAQVESDVSFLKVAARGEMEVPERGDLDQVHLVAESTAEIQHLGWDRYVVDDPEGYYRDVSTYYVETIDGQRTLTNKLHTHYSTRYPTRKRFYLYDHLNRRTDVEIRDSETDAVLARTNYTYDALDRVVAIHYDRLQNGTLVEVASESYTHHPGSRQRRIRKRFENGALVGEWTYKWNGQRLLAEQFEDEAEKRYLYDGNRISGYTTTTGERISYVYDILRDITHHMGDRPDGSGIGVVRRNRYDAYGVVLSEEVFNTGAGGLIDSQITSGLKYKGQTFDAETGQVYLRNRYYEPETGQFTQVDPARAGDNWFAYAGGDPVNRWDPSGLDWEWTEGGWRPLPDTEPFPMPWWEPTEEEQQGGERIVVTKDYYVEATVWTAAFVRGFQEQESGAVTSENIRELARSNRILEFRRRGWFCMSCHHFLDDRTGENIRSLTRWEGQTLADLTGVNREGLAALWYQRNVPFVARFDQALRDRGTYDPNSSEGQRPGYGILLSGGKLIAGTFDAVTHGPRTVGDLAEAAASPIDTASGIAEHYSSISASPTGAFEASTDFVSLLFGFGYANAGRLGNLTNKALLTSLLRYGGRFGVRTSEGIATIFARRPAIPRSSGGPGLVPAGTTDLSLVALAHRITGRISGGRNVAVFEIMAGEDRFQLVAASQRNVGHAERILGRAVEELGIDPSQVTRIYSELEPCGAIPGGYCKRYLNETFPQAEKTWSFPYGQEAIERRAAVEALKEFVRARALE